MKSSSRFSLHLADRTIWRIEKEWKHRMKEIVERRNARKECELTRAISITQNAAGILVEAREEPTAEQSQDNSQDPRQECRLCLPTHCTLHRAWEPGTDRNREAADGRNHRKTQHSEDTHCSYHLLCRSNDPAGADVTQRHLLEFR